ncbi:MAG: hypothetical protein IIA92_07770 [Chloroflexi bacterium]|nr:hypothetical protein [Chloroflexota bacterium]
MRNILSGYFYKVAVGAGLLILIGLISADIWLWQRDDGSGQGAGAGQGAQDGFEAPGFPARNTTGGANIGDGGPASSGATASDSAELEIQRGGAEPGEVETIQIEGTSGAGSELTAGGEATASDSAVSGVRQEETPPPPGGPGDVAALEDSAEIVVRDAEGNIKQQETVK